MLARGDRRAFVVVDTAGDVHSLARQIEGAKTKDVKARLEGLNLSRLPPVERAKIQMAQRAQARQDAMRADVKRQAAAREDAGKLKTIQQKRRAKLDLLWQKMKIRQMHGWKVLLAHIKGEEERHLRRHWLEIGLAKYLKQIAVIRQLLEYYADRRRRSLEEYHRQLKESLQRRHENEARELRRRYEALLRLEQREWAAPVFAVWHGAGDQVTYSFGQHDPYWAGGWYGMGARADGDAWFADQDPADYMRPVADYEMAFDHEPPDDPEEFHASFGDAQTYAWSDDLSGSFNAAAYGAHAAGRDSTSARDRLPERGDFMVKHPLTRLIV